MLPLLLACAPVDPGEPAPPRPDRCDGRDDDGDGRVDEDGTPVTRWPDLDGDGWGGTPAITGCHLPPGLVRKPGDCDDTDPAVSPGASEHPWDGVDDDCDPATPDDDVDGDGHPLADDCDDTDPERFEACGAAVVEGAEAIVWGDPTWPGTLDAALPGFERDGELALGWGGAIRGVTLPDEGRVGAAARTTWSAADRWPALQVPDVTGDTLPDLLGVTWSGTRVDGGGGRCVADLTYTAWGVAGGTGERSASDAAWTEEDVHTVGCSAWTTATLLGDVDQDGRPDVLWATGSEGESAVTLLEPAPEGVDRLDGPLPPGTVAPWPAGDLDGDGVDDLVFPSDHDETFSVVPGPVPWPLDHPSGTTTWTDPGLWAGVGGDSDGDGRREVLLGDRTDLRVVPSDRSGSPVDVALAVLHDPDGQVLPARASARDLDADGRDELVFADDRAVWLLPGGVAGVVDLSSAPRLPWYAAERDEGPAWATFVSGPSGPRVAVADRSGTVSGAPVGDLYLFDPATFSSQ